MRARDAPAAEAADDIEQCFQDEAFVSAPRCRGRGRGRGRVRPQPVDSPEVEQEPLVEPKAPEIGPTVNAVGILEINQGLATLNQTMFFSTTDVAVENQEMTDADAAVCILGLIECRLMVLAMPWITLTPLRRGLELDLMTTRK